MASSEASFAVVDLSISLLSFVNIELRSQGWYAVRVRLLPDPRIKAVWPYRTALSDATEQPAGDQIGKAEEGWSWHSRVFPIRYTLEEVPLGESPCFQVFLRNPTESLQTASLLIELELLHQEADIVSNPAPPVNFLLKPVARDVIRLSRVCEGVAAYYAASWGPAYFGLCHTTCYALLSGYVPARFLYSLRSTTGRDLRRPLSQRAPSGKLERSLSVASGSKAEGLLKKGGWRGMMCGNIDTDQSYDVLRTLVAKEIQPRGSPEPSPSATANNLLGHSSPRLGGKCGFAYNQTRMSRGQIGATKGPSTPTRSPRTSIGSKEQPSAAADPPQAKHGQKDEEQGVSSLCQQQQQQKPAQSQEPDHQEEHRQGSPTRSDPGQGGSQPRPAHGPKYAGNAPAPLVVTPAQIAMTASPSFAEATPPPFSLSRLSRTLGLGDRTFSSGVAEGTAPLTPKSDTSPHNHTPFLSLTSPSVQATPPLSMPSAPVLLTPPEPIASPSKKTAHNQATASHAAPDSAQEEHSSSPQQSEHDSQAHYDLTSVDSLAHALPPAAYPKEHPVPPLQLTPRDQKGAASLHPAGSLEAPSKVVAFADPQAGGAVAVPTPRPLHHQPGPPVSSGVLLPPLHTARNSRRLPSLKPSENALSEDKGREGQSDQVTESTSESITLEVASWVEVPDPALFLSWLPPSCSLGAAVLYLEAVLARLRAAASSEWAVLQWVLRVSNVHATRHFKCLWESEQPGLVQPWVSQGVDSSSIQTVATLESKARAVRQSLQQQVSSQHLQPPRLHQPRVWDYPGQQPVLLVDDSKAPHITTWCMTGDTESEQPNGGPSDGPCKTSRTHPEPDSLHCYNKNNRGTHLCVFVHGYQGASTDLSLIKGQMGLLYPHVDMMCSKANEVSGRVEQQRK
ncbi:hypothetical protein DUNSADRAFT_13881 [Dunaliella salina]|uniref:DUF676 domain-containing protein n=1 Tax=Dunaliella salina TaxID=3046 RepID=A0ABQ7H343_DUNSA|nr:hypothetical protein DUNSADRAFT_13881 [Dunaliella salina]|eukprot:KAF5841236.1 hypothetical protein DUNSADRAFT_13881 [Dunaliella salina]